MPVVVPPPPELDLGASSPPSSLPTSTVAAPAAVTPQKASPPPKTPVGKSPKSPMEEQIEKQQAELLEAQKQMAEMRAQLTSLQEQQKATNDYEGGNFDDGKTKSKDGAEEVEVIRSGARNRSETILKKKHPAVRWTTKTLYYPVFGQNTFSKES